jgi:hypothetical protein
MISRMYCIRIPGLSQFGNPLLRSGNINFMADRRRQSGAKQNLHMAGLNDRLDLRNYPSLFC